MSNEDRAVLDVLVEGLEVGDASNPQEVARALHCARMTMWTSFSLVRDQVGDDAATQMVRDLLSDPTPAAVSVAPAPVTAQVPTPVVRQNPAAALQARAEVVYDTLTHQTAAESNLDARALIWAAASYLYDQQGEEQSVGFLKAIQAKVSVAAWFEQLPVASVARN